MTEEEAIELLISSGDFGEERPCAICSFVYSPNVNGGDLLCEMCEEDTDGQD